MWLENVGRVRATYEGGRSGRCLTIDQLISAHCGAGWGRQWALINAIWRTVCVSDHGYCHRQSDSIVPTCPTLTQHWTRHGVQTWGMTTARLHLCCFIMLAASDGKRNAMD